MLDGIASSMVGVEMLDRDEDADGGGDGGGRWGEDVVAEEMVMKLVVKVVVVEEDVRLLCVDASAGECVELSGTLLPRHASCKTAKSAVKVRAESRGISSQRVCLKSVKKRRDEG